MFLCFFSLQINVFKHLYGLNILVLFPTLLTCKRFVYFYENGWCSGTG